MHPGKLIRMRQFMDEHLRTFILAVDTVIPRGVPPALANPMEAVRSLQKLSFDAFLLHSGLVKTAAPILAGHKPFLIKLTTATTETGDRTNRLLVDSVEHAQALGASGVAVNIFIGSEHEACMLAQFRDAVATCDQLGMPLLAMINPMPSFQFDPFKLAYVCRVAFELGADFIKTDYPGNAEAFRQMVQGCSIPLLVEESPYPEDEAGTLATTREVIEQGGAGVMFGERVWTAVDPYQITAQISHIIHPP